MPTMPTTPRRQRSPGSPPRRPTHLVATQSAHRLLAVALLGLTLALGLASCSAAPQSDALAAAQINGHNISLSLYQQLEAFYRANAAFQGQPPVGGSSPAQRANLREFHQQIMQFVANVELLRDQMQAQHLSVGKKNQQAAEALVNHAVAQDKLLMAQSPKDTTLRALVAAETPDVLAYLINQQAMLTTFEQQGKVPAIAAQVILVPSQADAQQLLNQAQHGADFATLARQHSLDTTRAAKGGDYGAPIYVGGLGKTFDKQVFGPHPIQYIIVPISSDYVLFKINQHSMQPLSGVSDPTLQQQYLTNWLTNVLQPQAQVKWYVTA
ncbi:MAG: peptidylprolyl isomerase [Ktedonobacterales bacterium]